MLLFPCASRSLLIQRRLKTPVEYKTQHITGFSPRYYFRLLSTRHRDYCDPNHVLQACRKVSHTWEQVILSGE